MSNNRRSVRFWVDSWWPVVAAIGVIMLESTESMGADHTTGPLRAIFQWLFGHVSDQRWEIFHHYIRKSGHFLGYGLVGLSWLRAWWHTLPRSKFFPDAGLALLGTAIVASCDEWHQAYLPNRNSSVWDVLLDCCGALTMQIVVYAFMRAFRPKKLAHLD